MLFRSRSTTALDKSILNADWGSGVPIGTLRIGKQCLYYRKLMFTYYVPYTEIRRVFRRVILVPAKLVRKNNDMHMENLIVCTDAGEIAMIRLPGTQTAHKIMDLLKERIPDAEFTSPK